MYRETRPVRRRRARSAVADEVYPVYAQSVNQLLPGSDPAPRAVCARRRAAWLAAGAWVAAPWLGCAAPPPRPVERFLLAVRYDVEPTLRPRAAGAEWERVRSDFRAMADAGFAAVMAVYLTDDARPPIERTARETGLAVAELDRQLRRFVLTGALPSGVEQPAALLRSPAPSNRSGQPLRVVERGATAEQRARSAILARSTNPPIFFLGGDAASADDRTLTLVRVDAESARSPGSLRESWLGQWHRGLAEGRTAGLLVDRWRGAANVMAGLEEDGTGLTVVQQAALRELVGRAAAWGPRLYRARVVPLGAAAGPADVRIVGLARGDRRYALIWNPSSVSFVRGEVALPPRIGAAPIRRAVEVPTTPRESVGQVVVPTDGRLILVVDLRPGDAVLYELF